MTTKRVDLKDILADPAQRRELLVTTLIATQAREGITTTREQAERAVDKVHRELMGIVDREQFAEREERFLNKLSSGALTTSLRVGYLNTDWVLYKPHAGYYRFRHGLLLFIPKPEGSPFRPDLLTVVWGAPESVVDTETLDAIQRILALHVAGEA